MHDVTKFQVEARAAITEEWAVCTLNDGKIMGWGKGYEYKVEGGVYADCGFKLVAKYGHGKYFFLKIKHSTSIPNHISNEYNELQ